MLAARMRHGERWSDANILNISSRGLLLHASRPPSRGTYVEVRRGAHVIVGRVIWAQAGRFGVRAQDAMAIDSLIANVPLKGQAANDRRGADVERRSRPRTEALEWRYARSSNNGRALQFLSIGGLAFILAACAYGAVLDTLSHPLSIVSAELTGASR
jgi:hypothetical protein